MFSRIFRLVESVSARKLSVRKVAREVLEQRQLLAARPLGELPGGFSAELFTERSTDYRFSVSGAVQLNAWVGVGTATILDDKGKPLASGRKLSHVLGTGSYTLQANAPSNTVLQIGTKRVPAVAPSQLKANAWGSGSVQLHWFDNADTEVQYRVDRWTKQGWRRSVRVGENMTAAVIDKLPAGSRTTYRVSAVSANGGSVRSLNTVTAQTLTEDTSGWYKVDLSGATKGETSQSMVSDTLKIWPPVQDNGDAKKSKWVYAGSWQAAVWQSVGAYKMENGQAVADPVKTKKSGGDDVTFPFGNGDFRIGTAAELKAQAEATAGNVFDIGGGDQKMIVLEDSYGQNTDYDDFSWNIDTRFVRITEATFTDVNNTSVGSITATDTETDPLWVEGWHSGGAKVSVTTDLNDSSAAEHVLLKLTDMATGSEQTMTLADVETSKISFGATIIRVEMGLDVNMDGILGGSGSASAASAMSGTYSGSRENFAALNWLEEEGIFVIGLFFGPLAEGIAAVQSGIAPNDLSLLAQYTAGRTAIYNLAGAQHTAYFADNDIVAAIAKFDQQFGQHIDQKGAVLTQANAQTTFDFTPTYNTPGAGESVQIQDSVFSMGNGFFQSRYTGTITAIEFDANGKATKWRVSGTSHRFARDFFRKPAGDSVPDIQPGFPLHADRNDTIQEDRTAPVP